MSKYHVYLDLSLCDDSIRKPPLIVTMLYVVLLLSALFAPLLLSQELTGNWRVEGILAPSSLRETYFNSETQGTRVSENSRDIPRENESLVDLFFEDPFESSALRLEFQANGNLEDIGVKQKSSLALADAAGIWRVQSLIVPRNLSEVYLNAATQETRLSNDASDFAAPGEALVDVFFPVSPQGSNNLISVDEAGAVMGTAEGTVSLSEESFQFTPSDGGEPIILTPNVSGDVMIGPAGDDDELELLVFVKVSTSFADTFEDLVNFQSARTASQLSFTWNEADGFQLATASGLSDWNQIPDTEGQDAHTVDFTQGREFFRIQREVDPVE